MIYMIQNHQFISKIQPLFIRVLCTHKMTILIVKDNSSTLLTCDT